MFMNIKYALNLLGVWYSDYVSETITLNAKRGDQIVAVPTNAGDNRIGPVNIVTNVGEKKEYFVNIEIWYAPNFNKTGSMYTTVRNKGGKRIAIRFTFDQIQDTHTGNFPHLNK